MVRAGKGVGVVMRWKPLMGWLFAMLTGILFSQASGGDLAPSVVQLEQVQSFVPYDGFQLALLAQTPEMNIRLNKLTDRIKRHSHPQTHHFLYFVKGEVELTLGDETRRVGPGAFVTIPQGTRHSMHRLGEAEVLFLDLATPPDTGDVQWHE